MAGKRRKAAGGGIRTQPAKATDRISFTPNQAAPHKKWSGRFKGGKMDVPDCVDEGDGEHVPDEKVKKLSFPAGVEGKKAGGFLFGIALFLVFWLTDIPGLSAAGAHALAIALLIAAWWIFLVCPPVIPALVAPVLFYVTGTVPAQAAFSGFSNSAIWLLFFGLVISKGVEKSGLGRRIAVNVLSRAKLTFSGLTGGLICLCFIFPFLVPSTSAVVALLMTLIVGIFDVLGIEKDSATSILLTCFIGGLCMTVARLPLTGALSNYIAIGLTTQLTGEEIGWLEWLKAMWVIAPLPMIGTYFYVTRRFTLDYDFSPEHVRSQLEKTRRELGRMTVKEKKALLLVSAALLLWTFGGNILSASATGILIGCLFLMPYVGTLSMEEFGEISLMPFLLAGGSYSIGYVLQDVGFSAWAVDRITTWHIWSADASLFEIGLFIILSGFVLHFLLETLGEVSLLTPIFVQLGGISAKAVAMLTPYGAGLCVFPYQASVIVVALSFNTTTWKETVRYGCFLSALCLLQAVLLLKTYWAWIL